MSTIIIKEVNNQKELKKWINFPLDLYKDNPYFVPTLWKEELETWDRKKNPVFQYAMAKQFLAYKEEKIVGRIAVIYNRKEADELGEYKVRFGWLDFINDKEVAELLISKAKDFAQENNVQKIEGPMGFTNLDKSGMLTMGFKKIATMIGLYNDDYYPKIIEEIGLKTEKEWVEYEIIFPKVLPEKVEKFSSLVAEKYNLRVLNFKNKKEILPYVDPMFKLLDQTYKHLSTYTPISKEQITTYKEKYFPFIHKNYIICIADQQDNLVAFAITMPSYSKALQKSKGKLLPFGWWHFLQAGKKNDSANFYLIGIQPEYQRRGVTAIIFKEIFIRFHKMGVIYTETNPELAENKQVQVLWQDYNPVNHKRRKTFSLTW